MLELSDRKWAEFRIDQLFTQERGREPSPKSFTSGNTRIISETACNNGLVGYATPNKVIKGNCISVSVNNARVVFYQPFDFCASVNIMVLRNDKINEKSALFIVPILIEANLKYNYGAKQSKDRLNATIISLPIDDNGQPDYNFMEQYIAERERDYSWATGCIEPNAEISLSDREWAEFKIKDLFKVSGTKTTKDGIKESGKYPYLTTQATNNSVNGYTDFATEKGNCIVAESACVGYSSYQETDFTASDHVEKLTPYSQRFNKFIGLFINTMLRKATEGKYNYGHKFNQGRIKETIISLPVTPDGKPDYDFMEQYMKSLPFSKVLE